MSDVYKAPDAQLHDDIQPGEYGSVEKALAGNYRLQPIDVIKEAWAKLPGFKMPFWIATAIYFVGVIVFATLQGLAGDPAQGNVNWPVYIGLNILQVVVLTPMLAGLFLMAIKHSVGAHVQFGEIFKHYDKLIGLFLMTVMMYLMIGIGLVLFVVPGVYLMVAFSMALPLMVEKNMGAWEALMASRKAVTHKWFNMLGLFLLSLLVVFAGALALLVGLIWAYPLVVLAYAMVYRDMFGVEASTLNS